MSDAIERARRRLATWALNGGLSHQEIMRDLIAEADSLTATNARLEAELDECHRRERRLLEAMTGWHAARIPGSREDLAITAILSAARRRDSDNSKEAK